MRSWSFETMSILSLSLIKLLALATAFFNIVLQVHAGAACKISEFPCRNGQCIRLNDYCDGIDDCGDTSDEPSHCTVCNRTYYGDIAKTYDLHVAKEAQDVRPPFLCHLTFTANGQIHGDIVQLMFDEFQLGRYEASELDGCPDGYMQLSELGRPFTGGSWCGTSTGSAAYYSETSTVTVTLKLLASSQLKFSVKLRYRFVSRREAVVRFGSPASPLERGQVAPGTYCTRQFEECYRKPCRLQSPNYPGMYPRNVSCYWSLKQKFVPTCKHAMIAVRQEAAHKMHMKRSINVAGLNKTTRALRAWRDCTGERDHLIFYDGGSTDDPVLAKYCGGDWLPKVVSRGPEMLVAFHSSPYSVPLHSPPSQSPLKGFELDVDIIFADSDSLDFARHHYKCEFNINASNPDGDEIWTGRGRKGKLISPKHSLPPNTTCTYIFKGYSGDIIWISFMSYNQRALLVGESGHALIGNSTFGGGCLTRIRIWDNRTLIEDKCDEPPLLCDHSALTNSTRSTRPCNTDESYISSGKTLILQHHTEDGTALHPAAFKIKYEFVDTRLNGDPWIRDDRKRPCHRIFKKQHVGEVTGPKNVFLFGRGGNMNLECIYRFEAGANERIRLTINNASFGINPMCETLMDPHSKRQICEYFSGSSISQINVYEVPWPDIRMPKGCICDNATLSNSKIIFESTSRVMELHFKVRNMKIVEDFTVLHFHAVFELEAYSTCPHSHRLKGDGGEIEFSNPPVDLPSCQDLPWLVEARNNKSLFILSWGAFLPLKPRQDEPQRCPTNNRILIYSGKPPKLVRAICPAEPGTKPLAVHVFSEEWRGENLAHLVQKPPLFVVEWISPEPSNAAFSWLEISRSRHSLLTQLQVSVNTTTNETDFECAHKCPELDACISASLWCDGKDHCPSGYDETEVQCGTTTKLLNSLPLAAMAAGFAIFSSIFLLICLTAHRLRARRRRKLAKKKLMTGPHILDPGLNS